MAYTTSREVAQSVANAYNDKRTSRKPKLVRLSVHEFRTIAGRSQLRHPFLDSVATHLRAGDLYLFRSREFFLVLQVGELWRISSPLSKTTDQYFVR
jgi:hypothetical protein